MPVSKISEFQGLKKSQKNRDFLVFFGEDNSTLLIPYLNKTLLNAKILKNRISSMLHKTKNKEELKRRYQRNLKRIVKIVEQLEIIDRDIGTPFQKRIVKVLRDWLNP